MKKREEEKIKNIEKARNIVRMQRQQEYKNQLRNEEIKEKEQKIEEFKRQCEKINQQKAQAAIEFQKQKDDVVKRFDQIVKLNKEIEPKTIKELFPEDDELYQKIKQMKEKQKQEEEKIKGTDNKQNENKDNKNTTE